MSNSIYNERLSLLQKIKKIASYGIETETPLTALETIQELLKKNLKKEKIIEESEIDTLKDWQKIMKIKDDLKEAITNLNSLITEFLKIQNSSK